MLLFMRSVTSLIEELVHALLTPLFELSFRSIMRSIYVSGTPDDHGVVQLFVYHCVSTLTSRLAACTYVFAPELFIKTLRLPLRRRTIKQATVSQ